MKRLSTILFFLLLHALIFAQDTGRTKKISDSSITQQKNLVRKDSLKKDSAKKNLIRKDSSQQLTIVNDSTGKDSAKKVAAGKTPFIKDSLQKKFIRKDSAAGYSVKTIINDSLSDSLKRDSLQINAKSHPVKRKLQKNNQVQLMPGMERNVINSDLIFYILIFLLFFLGLVKASFPKYVNSIFSLSFQATFRQSQTKDQIEQNFFPAFMLNVLFVLCGGLFITLFAQLNGWSRLPFWELFIYATAMLLVIYFIKYLVISFTGWVFNAKEAAAEYSFVVFLINKLMAILLIPLLFLIAYADNQVKNISVTIVICLAVFALVVRYLVSLSRIRKNLSVTAFHFFIYLCAVEIMPMLVIYKILFLQTSNR